MPGVDNLEVSVPSAGQGASSTGSGVSHRRGLFDREILGRATLDALRKFDPRVQVKNPVMFVVLIGTVVTFVESIAHPSTFAWSVTIWLALTVFFANFAEAVAEGRGKAQADALRRMRTHTEARRLRPDGTEERVPAEGLAKNDLVICEAVHAQAESPAATDWRQIVALYNQLVRIQPSPVVQLNRAVAIAM